MTAEPLSATAQDYVKVIWNATEWSDAPVTTKRLAERLGVSAPTVSEHVRKLAALGLVHHEPYGAITLTPEGSLRALDMVRRHRLIETFLVTRLGYGWDEVHDEAEVLEHACSPRMIDALDDLLGHPTRDPHGDPIPTRDGRIVGLDGVSLAAAPEGEWRVTRISDADPALLRDFAARGLVPGATIEVAESGAEPLIGIADSAPARLPADQAEAVWLVEEET